LDTTLTWSYDVEYIGAYPFTDPGKTYTCTVYAPSYAWFSIIVALIPQLLITITLQPMLVKNYCYIAAITMGAENQDTTDSHSHGKHGHDEHGHSEHGHGEHGHEEHGHGHFDEASFSHILGKIIEKMDEDEAIHKSFRELINGAIIERAKRRLEVRYIRFLLMISSVSCSIVLARNFR
jgi:hypothetical protein